MTDTATMQTPVDSSDDTAGDGPPDGDTVRLIRERSASTPQFHVYLTEETAAAGIDVGDTVAWDALPPETPDEPPMLICQRIPETESDLVPSARTVSTQNSAVHVAVPTDVLGRERNLPDEPPVALGLDIHDYDPENALHFDPLVQEGVVALVPVGFDDGRAFRFDIEQGIGYAVEHDRVGSPGETADEAPTADSPVSERTIRAVADATGVNAATLAEALDVVAAGLSPDVLPYAPDYDPLETDDGTVYVVLTDEFDHILDDILDVSSDTDALRDAVRTAHVDYAEDLIIDSGDRAREYRDATRDYAAVVLD